MAHADYDCCAICDSKQPYSSDADTKSEICADCLKMLRDEGIAPLPLDPEELIAWMQREPVRAMAVLTEIGFRPCCYPNPVDDAFRAIEAPAPRPTPESEGA